MCANAILFLRKKGILECFNFDAVAFCEPTCVLTEMINSIVRKSNCLNCDGSKILSHEWFLLNYRRCKSHARAVRGQQIININYVINSCNINYNRKREKIFSLNHPFHTHRALDVKGIELTQCWECTILTIIWFSKEYKNSLCLLSACHFIPAKNLACLAANQPRQSHGIKKNFNMIVFCKCNI